MRIVITGASGNVGTALLRRLTGPDAGHQVVGIARRPPATGAPYDAVSWVAADLADPSVRTTLVTAFAGADAVVHLAWGFQPARDTAYLDRVGVGGTRAVLRAVHEAGVPHLVHMSSLGVYSPGPSRTPGHHGADRADRADRAERVDESYARRGTRSLAYSREKVAAEDLLDRDAADAAKGGGHATGDDTDGGLIVTRLRPGLIVQADAGSALLRYGLPGWVPARVVRSVPVLPVDHDLVIQVVHTDDVADAIVRVLERRAKGAFNLAADPPVDAQMIADVLRARLVPVPRAVLRAAVDAAWRAHVSVLDPGWIDLAFDVPLMDCTRARTELGWEAHTSADRALAEAVAGMAQSAGTSSPALRPRRLLDQARRVLRSGPVSRRHRP